MQLPGNYIILFICSLDRAIIKHLLMGIIIIVSIAILFELIKT